MTDFPYVAPPVDGLAQALATARRRRLRTASLTTSLGASLALVVPLLLGGGSQAVLLPTPDPQQPAVGVTATPAPAGSHAAEANVASGPVVGLATRRTSPLPSAAPDPGTTGWAAAPDVTRRDRPTLPARPYAAGPLQRQDNVNGYVPSICLHGNDARATGLCTAASATNQGARSVRFEADVCNLDTSATPVWFDTSNEMDFTVLSSSGKPLWRWSTWHAAREAPHNISVDAGACTVWTFDWTAVAASGRALPDGDYQLKVDYLTADRLDPTTAGFILG